MPRQHTRRRPLSEINVVPYIDVMLVLLVIFMITAPLLTQGVDVSLPNTPAQPLKDSREEPLVVTVDNAGRMYLNYGDDPESPMDAEKLLTRASALLRHRPGLPVLVRGDKAAAYGDVVVAMALLQRAGASGVGLITEPPEAPSR
ncbi:MAG: protein TolR [Gammaproteobacteria bacterium]|nr:protein TolR [Gammaproteobacteria bacterium]